MQEIIYTQDGSPTLLNIEFNESYHSVKCGALLESLEKHTKPVFGFKEKYGKKIRILDVCFGLGYNAFCALLYAEQNNLSVEIISPEIDESLLANILEFNYPKEFEPLKPIFYNLAHNKEAIYGNSSIKIMIGDLRKTLPSIDGNFDAVFQDPFSPKNNTTLWSIEYFKELRSKMPNFGVITTYSCSSAVRLTMQEAGFFVYYLPLKAPLRSGTIASTQELVGYEKIDLEHKKKTNIDLKSISDFI
ncbi:MAG: hypothetical protein RL154_885 [Pseudomonadota bacterium]|jgi:tRNA U34 5-methylaminomethyl-2-thiouridine-forming methyltransferase MnmC